MNAQTTRTTLADQFGYPRIEPIGKRERHRSEGQEARHGHRVAKRDRQQSLRQDRGQKRAQAFA